MEKVKNILLIILGIAITLVLLWFFFAIALPILLILGLGSLIYFVIKNHLNLKPKNKMNKKKKDDIQEAIIVDEK